MSSELGDRIRSLRRTQGKSLRSLGSRTGLSATHLSEIERGRSSPTVGALVRIASALHRSPSELLQDGSEPWMTLTHSDQRKTLVAEEGGFRVHILSDAPRASRFQAYLVEVPEGTEHVASVLESSELVCLYALSGRVSLEIDGQRATLMEAASLQTVVNSNCSFRSEGGTATVLAMVSREAPPAN